MHSFLHNQMHGIASILKGGLGSGGNLFPYHVCVVADHHICVIRLGFLEQFFIEIGSHIIIGVASDEIFSRACFDGLFDGFSHALIGFILQDFDPLLSLGVFVKDLFQDLHAVVGGAVIHEDILQIGQGLIEESAAALLHEGACLVDGNIDGDLGHGYTEEEFTFVLSSFGTVAS